MQYAINGEYYGEMGFVKFQDFVRCILRKVAEAPYQSNEIFNEVMQRKVKFCEKEDKEDLDKAVTDKNLDRVKALLALGARADLPRADNKTNIMYCAEKDMSAFAAVLADNYCNPNITNEQGENTFWVASALGHYETAIVLRDHGADMNILSNAGITILHLAYSEKATQQELFDFLLEAGASPNTKNSECQSVLFIAFSKRDDEVAEMIQDKYGGDINTQTVEGNTLTHLALIAQDISRMEYYIGRKADIEMKNDFGHTIFMISMIIFSNLEVSKKLLDYGAQIDTQDVNGDTPLIGVCRLETFEREKFDFLLENHCNIDIQSNKREFALSVLISRKLDNEGDILLDMGAQFIDNESEFEPIAAALAADSQYWVEKLIRKGANALNTKFPVLVAYIEASFFNFELMKMMEAWNLVIGGPLQAALRKDYKEVCDFIWENSDDETKVMITGTQDVKGMIPISVALKYKNEKYINVLIKDGFDVQKQDNKGMTPFMYACKMDHPNAMNRIWKLIDLKNANLVDKKGNSALSYSAKNENIAFCNMMFCENISVRDIKCDSHGIIEAYQSILDTIDQVKKAAAKNLDCAKAAWRTCQDEYDHYDEKVKELEYGLKQLRNELDEIRKKDEISSFTVMRMNNKVEKRTEEYRRNVSKLNFAAGKLDDARAIVSKYSNRYQQISEAKRYDMLYNLSTLCKLGDFDDDLRWGNNEHNKIDWSKKGLLGETLLYLGLV